MLTKKDKEFLITTFVTKDDLKADLKAMEDRQDKKFATKNDFKKALRPVNSKLNKIIKYFDKDISWHTRRLNQLEEKLGVKPPEYILPPIKN